MATTAGSTTTYQHADHLSVKVSTDTAGNVLRDAQGNDIGEQGHYPFGESWYAGSGATKWRFTSYERDSESVNDYAMFRTYINRLGRFKSSDPVAGSVADPQSLNRYAYVRNDALNLIDPLGLCPGDELGRETHDRDEGRGDRERDGEGQKRATENPCGPGRTLSFLPGVVPLGGGLSLTSLRLSRSGDLN